MRFFISLFLLLYIIHPRFLPLLFTPILLLLPLKNTCFLIFLLLPSLLFFLFFSFSFASCSSFSSFSFLLFLLLLPSPLSLPSAHRPFSSFSLFRSSPSFSSFSLSPSFTETRTSNRKPISILTLDS